jgi:hypothetical protein
MLRQSSLGTIRPDPTLWVDPAGLRRWLVAACAFRFDLEQGQLLEACYPPGALSAEEELDIGFSCFPDSMATAHSRSSVHDCFFFFRLRRRGTPPQAPPDSATRRASTGSLERTPSKFQDLQPRSPSSMLSPRRSGGADKGGWASPSGGPSFSSPRHSLLRGVSDLGTSSPSAETAPGSSQAASMSPLRTPLRMSSSLDNRGATPLGPTPPPLRHASDSSSPEYHEKPSEERPTPGHHRRSATSETVPHPQGASGNGATGARTGGGENVGRGRFLYGFVFNRQRQDERMRRGGEQKSVVLLSERPFTGVFKPMVQIAGPLYFDTGPKALEQVITGTL